MVYGLIILILAADARKTYPTIAQKLSHICVAASRLQRTRLEKTQPKNGPRNKGMPCTASDGARILTLPRW